MYCLQVLDDWRELHWVLLLGQAHWKKRGDTSGPQFLCSIHAQRWNAENIFVSQTAVAKENITEEEELVEDFGDGYFAPYQQVFYQQDQDEDYVDNAGGQIYADNVGD